MSLLSAGESRYSRPPKAHLYAEVNDTCSWKYEDVPRPAIHLAAVDLLVEES